MFETKLYTFLLAQAFGLYFLISASIYIFRVKYYRELIARTENFTFAGAMIASLGMLLGIFLVLTHNVWDNHNIAWISLVSWIILLKSVIWLLIPEKMLGWIKSIAEGHGYYVINGIFGIIGAIMICKGLYLYYVHVVMKGVNLTAAVAS